MCVQFLIVLNFAWFVLLDCLWQLWVLFEYRIELIVSNFCLFVSLCCDNSGLLSTVMTRVLFWCLCRASLWPYLGMSSVKDIFKDKFVDHAVPQSLGLSDRHTKTRQTHQLLNAHWQWQGWLVLIVMLVLKSTCKSTMLSICVATIVLLHLCCSLWLLSFSIIVHLCCSFVLFICVVHLCCGCDCGRDCGCGCVLRVTPWWEQQEQGKKKTKTTTNKETKNECTCLQVANACRLWPQEWENENSCSHWYY